MNGQSCGTRNIYVIAVARGLGNCIINQIVFKTIAVITDRFNEK